ncbi:poly-gamma-glutamate hydrolase family protein [Streptomyces sp. NPDC005395]|uniref:poly-gamma-glutamate hydrolase family protein n=1 Tax=Streptomyces sp. NPDC005395 TaxID=3157042 RepID=UPI0033B1A0A6
MADKYASWNELISDRDPTTGELVNVEDRDWAITVRSGANSYVTHLAIHGGGIEPPTQQLADYAAGATGAFYCFAGIKSAGNEDLHITSTRFDEPNAIAHATAAARIVSWHGQADRTEGRAVTYVGGLDTVLGARIRARLAEAGFLCEEPPEDLAGVDPVNICNLGQSGAGVQLELSRSQHEQFYAGGDLTLEAIGSAVNRTDRFYRYVEAVTQGIADLDPGEDLLFDLNGDATQIFPTPVVLDQARVHQQADYDEASGLLYVTQVIGNGVTLADESGPPPTGTRDSRGDLAINRVDMNGRVTGVMYARAFDHGSGIGVENVDGTAYLWLSYDAEMQPIGTNAHGRRLVRVPFEDGRNIDVGDEGLDVYTPIEGATSITPGLDLAHGRMGIAYSTGSGTRYEIHDLTRFRARDFSAPLYSFARPSYTQFQSWCLFGNYVYQLHGTGYTDPDNPAPPDGEGNVWFTVIDIRSGKAVQRVKNLNQLSLPYREPEALSVWNLSAGPRLVYGFAVSDTPPRRMALYGIDALVATTVGITATLDADATGTVRLNLTVPDTQSLLSWQIDRIAGAIAQPVTGGDGESLPSTFVDYAPTQCTPILYRLTVWRQDGAVQQDESSSVTVVPEGGCTSSGAVGGEPEVLGCPESYTAVIHWRGGALPYPSASMDRLTKVTWSRTVNDVSDAAVTVLKGDMPAECCEALGDVEPWVHELTLYRDDELVWQGPILRTTERGETILIEAVDVFAWLDHVANTWAVLYNTAAADSVGRKRAPVQYIAWNHIRLNLTQSALSKPPDWANLMPYIVRIGETATPATSFIKAGSKKQSVWPAFVGDIVRELAKFGLVWTVLGRSIRLSSMRARTLWSWRRTGLRLTAADFAGDIEVIKDGTSAATYAMATTKQESDLTPGKTIGVGKTGTAYGRLDTIVELQGVDSDDPLSDSDIREAGEAALVGRYPVPVTVNIPQGSALRQEAPITIQQLVPGERFDVFADGFCTQLAQAFVLSDLEVEWDGSTEKVAISLTPAESAAEELAQ